MSKQANSPRVTYKDIMTFQAKVFDELTGIRTANASEFTAIRGEISEIKTEIKVHREAVKGLIRRDTIGYVWDSLTTLVAMVAMSLGMRK